MLENIGTQHRANDDTAEAIEIINGYSGGEETVYALTPVIITLPIRK